MAVVPTAVTPRVAPAAELLTSGPYGTQPRTPADATRTNRRIPQAITSPTRPTRAPTPHAPKGLAPGSSCRDEFILRSPMKALRDLERYATGLEPIEHAAIHRGERTGDGELADRRQSGGHGIEDHGELRVETTDAVLRDGTTASLGSFPDHHGGAEAGRRDLSCECRCPRKRGGRS